MLEKELKKIWRNSSQKEKIKFETSRLLLDLESKMSSMDKAIRNRDFMESAAAIFMIPVFGYFAYEIPFMLSKVGCIFIVVWCFYLIFKLRSVKKIKVPVNLTSSFRDQLKNQKNYIEHQAELNNSVFYWYLLPPFVGHALLVLGLGNPKEYNWSNIFTDFLPISLPSKIVYLTGVAVFYAGILWLNKYGVRKTYNPLIKDIEKVQLELENE